MDSVVNAALTSEFLNPSSELWVVSPWITDLRVLDNRDGQIVGLLDESCDRELLLSDVLSILVRMGVELHVATRPDQHNTAFIDRLSAVAPGAYLHQGPDLHEKTICGSDWVLSGSMNFTRRGFETNDEAITYTIDAQEAAKARLDIRHRWAQ